MAIMVAEADSKGRPPLGLRADRLLGSLRLTWSLSNAVPKRATARHPARRGHDNPVNLPVEPEGSNRGRRIDAATTDNDHGFLDCSHHLAQSARLSDRGANVRGCKRQRCVRVK
jgi:hypothetical protein